MFGIGETELVIIVIFAFLMFGPDKLPTMGRTIGRGLRQFREAQDGLTKVVQAEFVDPMSAVASAEAAGKGAASDADIEDDAKRGPKETFAERKRRLEAEKAAGESPADDAAAAEDVPADDSAVEEAPAPARTAAALYGLSRRSKPAAGDDADASEAEAASAKAQKPSAKKPSAKKAAAGKAKASAKKAEKAAKQAKSKAPKSAKTSKSAKSTKPSKDAKDAKAPKAKAKAGKKVAKKAAKKSGKGK